MKKKLLAMTLCICTAFSLVACGGDDTTENTTQNTTEAATVEKTEAKMTLGKYMGIEVDASLQNVSDEELDEYLQSILNLYTTYEDLKEGVIEDGDVMKISYTSTVDGEEYKSAEGYELDTARGFEIDGFIDGIVGHSVGEKVELDLTFPEDYSDTAYAGKDIHFDVTIEAKVNAVVPEFTNEFVAENFEYMGCATTEELLVELKNDLYINNIYNEIWENVVIKDTVVDSYDSDELQEIIDGAVDSQEYYVKTNYGVDIATYLEVMGVTEAEMMESFTNSAKVYLKQKMVVNAIAEAENIVVSEELYNKTLLEFAKADGYDTIEDFKKAYEGVVTDSDYEFSVLAYLVEEYVCENVIFVEGLGLRSEEETSTEGNAS